MKSKQIRDWVREILVCQFNHWALFPIYLLMMLQFGNHVYEPSMAVYALMGFYPFLLYLFRRWIPIWIGQGLAGLAILLVINKLFPLPTGIDRNIISIILMVHLIYSLILRLKIKKEFDLAIPVIIPLISSVLVAIVLAVKGETRFTSYLVSGLLICIVLFMPELFYRNYKEFAFSNEKSNGYMPEAQIFRSCITQVGIVSVLVAIVLVIISYIDRIDDAFHTFMGKFLAFSRNLFSKIRLPETETPDAEIASPPQNNQLIEIITQDTQNTLFRTISYYVIIALGICAACFFLIQIIRKILSLLSKRLPEGPVVTETEEDGVEEIHEFIKNPYEEKTAASEERGSFRIRIRKLYRQTIKKQINKTEEERPLSKTPRWWQSYMKKKDFAPIYEKARYSSEPITEHDYTSFKEHIQ